MGGLGMLRTPLDHYLHRRTGTTELEGAAPVCPNFGPSLPKKFPNLGGQKPCLPEHFARKSFTYYINFGSFARKIFFWGGCRPPRPLGSYAYDYLTLGQQVVFQSLELQEVPIPPQRLSSHSCR